MNYAIIAAGNGSRLAAEGVEYPKPLVPMCGKPMIGRLIDIFADCGAESISVIVNEEMTEVARYLRARAEVLPSLRIAVKSTPSSMHSFHEVASLLPSGKFILTTVDTIFRPEDFRRYAKAFEADDAADGFMAVTDYIDDEKPLYIGVDDDMRITAFSDTPLPGQRYISGGIYGLRSPQAIDILQGCIAAGQSRMRNYQRALVAAGLDLRAWPFSKILDVDHVGDIDKARQFLNSEL